MYGDSPAVEHPPLVGDSSSFAPTGSRYVKLGPGGAWAAYGLADGIIAVGFGEVSHEACMAGAWQSARADLIAAGYTKATASHWIRELRDFYEQDSGCLWWTIADGHLHWTFAEAVVHPINDATQGGPRRYRRALGGWRRADLAGVPLTTRSLSSALLRTAGYRMTICSVEQEAYLLRRIRGAPDPLHVEALGLKIQMTSLAERMIRQLDWRDFEILTDLILTRGGWQRGSAVGTGEVDVDLILLHPSTGETAWVQIKSSATQDVLDDYLERFDRDASCERFFFVCHSAKGALRLPARSGLHLWTGASLADAVLKAGLFDWLMERTQ